MNVTRRNANSHLINTNAWPSLSSYVVHTSVPGFHCMICILTNDNFIHMGVFARNIICSYYLLNVIYYMMTVKYVSMLKHLHKSLIKCLVFAQIASPI